MWGPLGLRRFHPVGTLTLLRGRGGTSPREYVFRWYAHSELDVIAVLRSGSMFFGGGYSVVIEPFVEILLLTFLPS